MNATGILVGSSRRTVAHISCTISTFSFDIALLLCQGERRVKGVGGRGHGVVDGADEVAFEAADRFSLCFAFGDLAGNVVLCGWVDPDLGDGDAVEGGV